MDVKKKALTVSEILDRFEEEDYEATDLFIESVEVNEDTDEDSAEQDNGWAGFALVVIFCFSVLFSAIRLGRCWVILEERWPEYKELVRQPYMEIGDKALGIIGRRLALFCIMVTLVGSNIVYIILIGEFLTDLVPALSQCQYVIIVGAVLLPFCWLGSPKDFWQASVLAVVATVIAVVVILVRIYIDFSEARSYGPPRYDPLSITSFSLGFGGILFAFGGSSVFPTIQNDMKDRSKFTQGAIICFTSILCMYAPVAFFGYYFIGSDVQTNIFLNVDQNIYVIVAIILQIINLLATFLISFSPVTQAIEDILHMPSTFGVIRVASRSAIVIFEVLVALAIPDFGLILNIIGGSTITILSFILPPICYMRLVDDKSQKHWPERNVAVWERIYLWCIVLVGFLGAISSTISGLMEILNPESFGKSCFVNFNGNTNLNETLIPIIELLETA